VHERERTRERKRERERERKREKERACFVSPYLSIRETKREHALIERNPAPRGGFLFTMFPDQEPGS